MMANNGENLRPDIVCDVMRLESLKSHLALAIESGSLMDFEQFVKLERQGLMTDDIRNSAFLYVGEKAANERRRADAIISDCVVDKTTAKIKETWNSVLTNVDVFIDFDDTPPDRILIGLFVMSKGNTDPKSQCTIWVDAIPKE